MTKPQFEIGDIAYGYGLFWRVLIIHNKAEFYWVEKTDPFYTRAKWGFEATSRHCRLATELEKVLYL